MTHSDQQKLFTIPNIISLLRLVCIGLFLWFLIGKYNNSAAIIILGISGLSDWLDGKLARLLNQASQLGALLDPAIDRIYMISVPVCLGIRGFIPWWIIIVLLARDTILAILLPGIRSRGITALPVIYIGKAGTFALMAAFPLILLGHCTFLGSSSVLAVGWGFLLWGLLLYVWSFMIYLYHSYLIIHTLPKANHPSFFLTTKLL